MAPLAVHWAALLAGSVHVRPASEIIGETRAGVAAVFMTSAV
jgi:hypothetical protein